MHDIEVSFQARYFFFSVCNVWTIQCLLLWTTKITFLDICLKSINLDTEMLAIKKVILDMWMTQKWWIFVLTKTDNLKIQCGNVNFKRKSEIQTPCILCNSWTRSSVETVKENSPDFFFNQHYHFCPALAVCMCVYAFSASPLLEIKT